MAHLLSSLVFSSRRIASPQRFVFWLALVAISVGAAWGLRWTLAQGIGVEWDSPAYVEMARTGPDGQRFLTRGYLDFPEGHFPPGYPFALSIVDKRDPFASARSIALVCYGVSVFLTGLLIERYSGGRSWAGLIGAALTAASLDTLQVHAYLLSEPLFLLNIFLSYWLFDIYAQRQTLARVVVFALVASGLPMIRYAGMAWVTAGLASVGWVNRDSARRQWSHTTIYALLSVLPSGLWLLQNAARHGNAVGRDAYVHVGVLLSEVHRGYESVLNWFAPTADGSPQVVYGWLLLAGFVALAIVHYRRVEARLRQPGCILPMSAALAYAGLLIGTLVYWDDQTILDYRILLPLHLTLLILCVSWIAASRAKAWLHAAWAVWISVHLGWLLKEDWRWMQDSREDGFYYDSQSWKESPLIAWVCRLPPDRRVYSNAPAALYVYAGRRTRVLPHYAGLRDKKASYVEGLKSLRQEAQLYDAAEAYFRTEDPDGHFRRDLEQTGLHCEPFGDDCFFVQPQKPSRSMKGL